MALLQTSQLAMYLSSIPYNFTYFNSGGAALTDQVLVPASAVPVGSSLAVSFLHIRSTNLVTATLEDTGNTSQLVLRVGPVAAGAFNETTLAPADGPVLVCNPSTGLQITTSADPGIFSVTMIVRLIPALT